MEAVDKIPVGHKVALCDISQDEMIIKYGIPIGKATIAIKKGQWVHLHNIRSNYDLYTKYIKYDNMDKTMKERKKNYEVESIRTDKMGRLSAPR